MRETPENIRVSPLFDDPRDYSLVTMFKDFFHPNMGAVIAIVYFYGLVFLALLIYSGIKFFTVAATRDQILYAGIFLGSLHVVALMKIFAWQTMHRNHLKRDIRKLAEFVDQMLSGASES